MVLERKPDQVRVAFEVEGLHHVTLVKSNCSLANL